MLLEARRLSMRGAWLYVLIGVFDRSETGARCTEEPVIASGDVTVRPGARRQERSVQPMLGSLQQLEADSECCLAGWQCRIFTQDVRRFGSRSGPLKYRLRFRRKESIEIPIGRQEMKKGALSARQYHRYVDGD